ncbi:hypothetical protein SNEBB_002799 [Seison nebaliae]|nr:hypothetical protein SNEBB_002799 [Seison nebaliae]
MNEIKTLLTVEKPSIYLLAECCLVCLPRYTLLIDGGKVSSDGKLSFPYLIDTLDYLDSIILSNDSKDNVSSLISWLKSQQDVPPNKLVQFGDIYANFRKTIAGHLSEESKLKNDLQKILDSSFPSSHIVQMTTTPPTPGKKSSNYWNTIPLFFHTKIGQLDLNILYPSVTEVKSHSSSKSTSNLGSLFLLQWKTKERNFNLLFIGRNIQLSKLYQSLEKCLTLFPTPSFSKIVKSNKVPIRRETSKRRIPPSSSITTSTNRLKLNSKPTSSTSTTIPRSKVLTKTMTTTATTSTSRSKPKSTMKTTTTTTFAGKSKFGTKTTTTTMKSKSVSKVTKDTKLTKAKKNVAVPDTTKVSKTKTGTTIKLDEVTSSEKNDSKKIKENQIIIKKENDEDKIKTETEEIGIIKNIDDIIKTEDNKLLINGKEVNEELNKEDKIEEIPEPTIIRDENVEVLKLIELPISTEAEELNENLNEEQIEKEKIVDLIEDNCELLKNDEIQFMNEIPSKNDNDQLLIDDESKNELDKTMDSDEIITYDNLDATSANMKRENEINMTEIEQDEVHLDSQPQFYDDEITSEDMKVTNEISEIPGVVQPNEFAQLLPLPIENENVGKEDISSIISNDGDQNDEEKLKEIENDERNLEELQNQIIFDQNNNVHDNNGDKIGYADPFVNIINLSQDESENGVKEENVFNLPPTTDENVPKFPEPEIINDESLMNVEENKSILESDLLSNNNVQNSKDDQIQKFEHDIIELDNNNNNNNGNKEIDGDSINGSSTTTDCDSSATQFYVDSSENLLPYKPNIFDMKQKLIGSNAENIMTASYHEVQTSNNPFSGSSTIENHLPCYITGNLPKDQDEISIEEIVTDTNTQFDKSMHVTAPKINKGKKVLNLSNIKPIYVNFVSIPSEPFSNLGVDEWKEFFYRIRAITYFMNFDDTIDEILSDIGKGFLEAKQEWAKITPDFRQQLGINGKEFDSSLILSKDGETFKKWKLENLENLNKEKILIQPVLSRCELTVVSDAITGHKLLL